MMRTSPLDVDGEPLIRLHSLHNTNAFGCPLQDRPLLNVKLEVSPNGYSFMACRHVTEITDPLELRLDSSRPIDLLRRMSPINGDLSRPDARGHHADREPGTFFTVQSQHPQVFTGADGTQHEDTYLVQFTTPTGYSVSTLCSLRILSISMPACTPRMPS